MTDHAKGVPQRAQTVSNVIMRGLLQYSEAIGLSRSVLIHDTGLQEKELINPDGLATVFQYDRLLSECVNHSKDDFFGLRSGTRTSLSHLGVLGFLLLNAETFGDALYAYQRYQENLGELVTLSIASSKGEVRIELISNVEMTSRRHLIEAITGCLRNATQELTGRELQFRSVTFTHSIPAATETYHELLGVQPSHGKRNVLVLDAHDLARQVVTAVPELLPLLESQLERRDKIRLNPSVASRVRNELIRALGKEENGSLESISRMLAISTRSLQQQLKEEGLSFRDVQQQVQTEFALRFLTTGRSVSEISYALGFSDPSAFKRAFRRWTGVPPGKAREMEMRH